MKIVVPNFTKWQKPTTERRGWFAIDADFFFNRQVREARRLCADAPDCFIALWSQLDENGEVEISEVELRRFWKEVTCSESNNFDPNKRLNALLKAGLIHVQNPSKHVFKPCLNHVQTLAKDSFEVPETPVALSKNKTNKQTNNYPPTPQGGDGCEFEKVWKIYPNKQKKAYAKQIWSRKKLDSKLADIVKGVEMYKKTTQWQKEGGAFVPSFSTFLNQQLWLDELSETGKPIGKKPMPHRIMGAKAVRFTTDNGLLHTEPGSVLKWDDMSRVFRWNGQEVYIDQVEILEP